MQLYSRAHPPGLGECGTWQRGVRSPNDDKGVDRPCLDAPVTGPGKSGNARIPRITPGAVEPRKGSDRLEQRQRHVPEQPHQRQKQHNGRRGKYDFSRVGKERKNLDRSDGCRVPRDVAGLRHSAGRRRCRTTARATLFRSFRRESSGKSPPTQEKTTATEKTAEPKRRRRRQPRRKKPAEQKEKSAEQRKRRLPQISQSVFTWEDLDRIRAYGVNLLFGDGKIKLTNREVELKVLEQLGDRADGKAWKAGPRRRAVTVRILSQNGQAACIARRTCGGGGGGVLFVVLTASFLPDILPNDHV